MNNKDFRKIKIEVVTKNGKSLSPTNALIAKTLILREKAVWIEKHKKIMQKKWEKVIPHTIALSTQKIVEIPQMVLAGIIKSFIQQMN